MGRGPEMAQIDPKSKVIGPFSPKEFSDTSTLASAIDSAAGSLTSSTSATSLIASEAVVVMGNVFVILTYV